ncbi:hypothetical protein LTR28_007117 [Elasticomyces elasticus]|nr:hypothetical protein LTR28_007117 [Elasticomyces elasticus]
MATRAELRTTFEPSRVIQPIYTGGSVALSQNGRILATSLGEEALVTDLSTGEHLARLEGDGESITTLSFTTAVDSTGTLLATGGADGVVKVWDIRGGFVTHTFHGHSGVISALHFFQVDGSLAETGSRSRKRKSRQQNYSAPEAEAEAENEATVGYRLASGSEDGNIRIWDLHKRKSVTTLDSHVSVVRSLEFSPEQNILLSASRDKTAILWDSGMWTARTTVPVLEGIEKAGFLSHGSFFFTGGETARVRIWDVDGKERTEEQDEGVETEAILDVLHCPTLSILLSVHADQTLVLHSLEPLLLLGAKSKLPALPIIRRISGTHDEVIDLAYVGSDRSLLALATNLEDVRLISLATSSTSPTSPSEPHVGGTYFGADVALLKGHSDIVITLDTDWSGHWLATGAKDNTAKLWRLDPANSSYTCYATFTGHAESLGAIALPHTSPAAGSAPYNAPLDHPPKFLITGSQDKTIKRWNITSRNPKSSSKPSSAVPELNVRASYTRKAHDRDINALDTSPSPSSALFATASQDRTVKIWDLETGESIGVLRGHKRGVWSVKFAPPGTPSIASDSGGNASSNKGMVVTGSGDKTVRIWSLGDYSCLRTFEGHVNSVLKVLWFPVPPDVGRHRQGRSVQVASAAGDGLVKVWDVASGECAATLDNHTDRVWALAVKPPPASAASATGANGSVPAATSNVESRSDAYEEDDEVLAGPPLELVSGSADSTLTFWTDTTAVTAIATATRATARVEQDQELQNYIHSANYREAITLALALDHPKRLLDLFVRVIEGGQEEGSLTGKFGVDEVLAALGDEQLWRLLNRIRDWNANRRTSGVAQHILNALLRLYPQERLINLRRRRARAAISETEELEADMGVLALSDGGDAKRGGAKESMKDLVDGLKAYTERHYARLEKMSEERAVLVWTLQQMDEVGGGEVDGDGTSLDGVGELRRGEDLLMLNGV